MLELNTMFEYGLSGKRGAPPTRSRSRDGTNLISIRF